MIVTLVLVDQLRFARSEFARSLNGVTDEEARQRFGPINSLGWMVGHLADQEQRYWLQRQGAPLAVPGLNALVGFGQPATTPSLSDMRAAWETVVHAVDPFLDGLTAPVLLTIPAHSSGPDAETVGTLLQRVIYHYWFHLGEGQAVRQMLGHAALPDFVGDFGPESVYRPGP